MDTHLVEYHVIKKRLILFTFAMVCCLIDFANEFFRTL